MQKNLRKARPTCSKQKKQIIEILDDDDGGLEIVHIYHPCGAFASCFSLRVHKRAA